MNNTNNEPAIYIACMYNSNEVIGESDSLQGAVHTIATTWNAPLTAFHTAQSGSVWTVFGPEGQLCANITLLPAGARAKSEGFVP